MSRRGALLVSLVLPLLALRVDAQPLEGPDGLRPPGTRTRTAAEERRYHTGPDELQPTIGRPNGFRALTAAEAEVTLRELRGALLEERSVESLRAGLEDYRAINARLERAAATSGGAVRLETIGSVHGLPVKAVRLVGEPSSDGQPRPRVLILGGVHSGTEKAGFESATRFVEAAAKDPTLRARFDVTVVPLVNPTSLVLGTRENARGVDINRTFEEGRTQPESEVLQRFVRGQRFDVALDLHTAGDPGRDGFFLIRAKPDGGLGARMMRALPSAALLDAPGPPGVARVGPYVLYGVGLSEIASIKGTTMDLVAREGTRYVYTFEAPTRADPKLQVDMTLRFLRSALENARVHGRFERPATRPEARTEVRPGARTAEARPEVAPSVLDPYRRADGTLDWSRLSRGRVLHEAGGLAHFGLALFLKEIAVVAATGDRLRIEEFFDGLLTTDFYTHYGLFVAGARVGEVAYGRYLQRHIKPRFVNGLLKTNLVLAAGIALPLIVNGQFEGKTFAISVASLGLSVGAVRSGVAGIRWVKDLSTAGRAGALARTGVAASRLARFGGWFYTAAELAVVLYVAEEVETRVNEHLALEEARDALAAAGETFVAALGDPAASADAVREASQAYHAAWNDYRNGLYQKLHLDEALLAARLEGVARKAKLAADERAATVERLAAHPALARSVVARHGSLEAYAEHLVREDERAIEGDVSAALASYNRDRERHLREVYEDHRRDAPLLAGPTHLDWRLAGGHAGAAGDPYAGRGDLFATLGRSRARAALPKALERASRNRDQAYDDEDEVLRSLAAALRRQGRDEHASVLERQRETVLLLQAMDRRLVAGDGTVDTRDRAGLVESLLRAADAEAPAR